MSQSELIPMIFNTELTHLGLKASNLATAKSTDLVVSTVGYRRLRAFNIVRDRSPSIFLQIKRLKILSRFFFLYNQIKRRFANLIDILRFINRKSDQNFL